jgi:hypothetical protein
MRLYHPPPALYRAVQESSLYLVLTAAIVQRGGGDVAWLAPYWGVLKQWANYLLTELPFPGACGGVALTTGSSARGQQQRHRRRFL